MTRQVEQLFPSWPGVADFPPTLQVAPGPVMLRELPRLAATLFPGREHPEPDKVQSWSTAVVQLVFRQPLSGVPRTFNADEMCTIMVWVSFPANFWYHVCKALCMVKLSFCREMASSIFLSLLAQHF